ncbi:MAG: hypothetical protein ABDH37_09130, partial [Candidatus Hydrothermales bacterium]
RWQQNRFVPIGNATSRDINSTNFNPDLDTYLGNILNWAVMSRIDVAKKVLTGGKGSPAKNPNILTGEGDGTYEADLTRYGWPTPSFNVVGTLYRFNKPTYLSSIPQRFYVQRYNTRTRSWENLKTYECQVDVSSVPLSQKIGIFRQIADKDLDGNWDPGKEIPRFGLFFFSTSV